MHGGTRVFHKGGVNLIEFGDGRHRNDQPAGVQTRARSEICYVTRAGNRLRLLARNTRDGQRRSIIANLQNNCQAAQAIIAETVGILTLNENASVAVSLKYGLRMLHAPAEAKLRLDCIVGKYLA